MTVNLKRNCEDMAWSLQKVIPREVHGAVVAINATNISVEGARKSEVAPFLDVFCTKMEAVGEVVVCIVREVDTEGK